MAAHTPTFMQSMTCPGHILDTDKLVTKGQTSVLSFLFQSFYPCIRWVCLTLQSAPWWGWTSLTAHRLDTQLSHCWGDTYITMHQSPAICRADPTLPLWSHWICTKLQRLHTEFTPRGWPVSPFSWWCFIIFTSSPSFQVSILVELYTILPKKHAVFAGAACKPC